MFRLHGATQNIIVKTIFDLTFSVKDCVTRLTKGTFFFTKRTYLFSHRRSRKGMYFHYLTQVIACWTFHSLFGVGRICTMSICTMSFLQLVFLKNKGGKKQIGNHRFCLNCILSSPSLICECIPNILQTINNSIFACDFLTESLLPMKMQGCIHQMLLHCVKTQH